MTEDGKNKPTEDFCLNNVKARCNAIQKAIAKPKEASIQIVNACANHESLANLEYKEFGISPMARNTMYKYANVKFADDSTKDGKKGWLYLNELRKEAKKIGFTQTSKRSKAALKEKNTLRKKNTKTKLDATEKHSLACSKAYTTLLYSLMQLEKSSDIDPYTKQKLRMKLTTHDEVYSNIFNQFQKHKSND